ncbi:hypothetical protein ACVXHA_29675 [Escherichia coli]
MRESGQGAEVTKGTCTDEQQAPRRARRAAVTMINVRRDEKRRR